MSKRLTTDEFIHKAREKHGDAYGYQHSTYVDQHTKVEIVCQEHGSFYMLPANHYWKGQRCPKCAEVSRRLNKTKTHDAFVNEANRIHRHTYEYVTPYVSQHDPITMRCSVHGEFSMTPNAHVSGKQGCPKCVGKHKTQDDWIQEFYATHSMRYDYSRSAIATSHEKITIWCNKHGEFLQTPSMHRRGQGCPGCAYDEHKGRYSRTFFDRHPELKDTPAFLYVLQFTSDDEQFVKVGVTSTTVEQRVRNTRTTAYTISILLQLPLTLYEAFVIEQSVLDLLRHSKYTPKEKFHGQTECLNAVCYEDIQKLIQEGAHIV